MWECPGYPQLLLDAFSSQLGSQPSLPLHPHISKCSVGVPRKRRHASVVPLLGELITTL